MLYDHFLARDFAVHAGMELPWFASTAYAALRAHAHVLPAELARLLPHIERDDWLGSYASREGITLVLERMERRLRHPLPLRLAAAAARRAELERKLAVDRREVTVDLIAASRIDEVTEKMGEIGGTDDGER